MNLLPRTRDVLDRALDAYRGTPEEERLISLRERLDEPLRVAVAGRVKSGKSTLLNALVGERLAPTDAGECTRIVTWYRDGLTYRAELQLQDGTSRQTRFTRDGGSLEVDLAGITAEDVRQIDITWPSRRLRTATLIDTPGIGSLTESLARRTWDLLAPEDDETPADAVVYLLKHLHTSDLEFLQAFHDNEVGRPNPVNAIGVLSRADEIGVGRLDSMSSARRIARRLAKEPTVRRVVQTVVPVAGLLAETAVTLTETEVRHLRAVAEQSPAQVERLLLSADRFVSADRLVDSMPDLELTSLERERLLDRFGLFGVRLATSLLQRAPTITATELSHELVARSGLDDVQDVLRSLFFERRDVLKSRSALLSIDALVRLRKVAGSTKLAAEVEEITSSAHPFNELRVLASIRAGWVRGKPGVVEELERVVGGSGQAPAVRLGLPEDADPASIADAARRSLLGWQRRAENPLTRHELSVAARVAVRSCEGILADLNH